MLTSPANKPLQFMSFGEAMEQLLLGRLVTRRSWNNPSVFLELREDKLMLYKEDGLYYDLIVSRGDLLGQDWAVAPPPIVD